MPLANTHVIDLIAKRPSLDGYDLVIVDDGAETDEMRRYSLLIEKLTAYLNYVRSGEFVRSYPEAQGHDVRCLVMCFREPSEAMLQLQAIKDPQDTAWLLRVVIQDKSGPEESKPRAPKSWWRFW